MPVEFRRLLSRLRSYFLRPSDEDGTDEELTGHLQLLQRRFEQQGLSSEDARRAAFKSFGGVEQLREQLRDQQSFPWLDALRQDVRYAIRTIARTPVVSLAVIVTFALGIGANTAIFSLVNSVLLTPLPYRSQDRLVVVEPFFTNRGVTTSPGSFRTSSIPDFNDWRAQSHVFDAIAYHGGGEFRVMVEGAPTFGTVQFASPDFFRVFGVAPAAGRFWTEQEDRASVAVVSHDWAVAHFGEPDKAIGRQFSTTRPLQIIGVAPVGFKYPRVTDIWFPAGVLPENTNRGAHNYLVVGRLKPGVPLEEARVEMRTIADRLAQQYPGSRNKTVALTPLREKLTADAQTTLWLLLGTVAGVLLIACVNVANLQLVRSTARGREMAVRSAMGAGPGRVMRQVLTESLLLGGVGCLVGLGAGWLTLKAFVAIAPADIPRLNEVHIDQRVLLFTLGLTAVCSVMFGLGPSRRVARLDVSAVLKQQPGKGVGGGVGSRARSLLVMAEVALSFALLVTAGLLLRSLAQLNRADLGFSTERVLTATTSMPAQSPELQRQAVLFYRDLLEEIRHMPGVRQAAGIRTMPFIGSTSDSGYTIDGNPTPPPGERPLAQNEVITPGLFETMGVRITRGRDFSADDEYGRPPVAIVNERLVRDSFGGDNPIGRTIRTGMTLESSQGMQIVGVVADTRDEAPELAASPEIYLPYLQHPGPGSRLELLTHTSTAPETIAASIREAAHALNPEVPVRFSTLDDAFGKALAYPRFRAVLVAGFAMLAVALALVGIYGVLSFVVAERTPEIGVRMALGALRRNIFSQTIGTSMRLVAGGLVAGFLATLAVVRVLQTVLYGVSSRDPLTIAAVAGLIIVTAFLASSVPALRASRVDPLIALRQD